MDKGQVLMLLTLHLTRLSNQVISQIYQFYSLTPYLHQRGQIDLQAACQDPAGPQTCSQ